MALLSGDDRARLRRRANDPAFAPAFQRIREVADAAIAANLEPPVRGAGWQHDYFCPTHGTPLVYDPASPHAHRCDVDGEILSGDPFDAAWIAFVHDEIVGGMRAASLLWVATGEERYARHVATKLAAYNERYARYPSHGEHAGKGRAMGQSLDEAVWAIPLAWSYDAVRDYLDDDLNTRLTSELLRWVGDHLLTQLFHRTHNIECWHLAGLATVGVVLDEERFVAPALNEGSGLSAQLRDGVLDDGWWYEGSPSYHFYTMRAVLALASALRYREPAVLDQPRLREMFAAPLRLARADLTLPATNDGWMSVSEPPGIGQYAAVYEQAWALWHDPAHSAVLARIYAGEPNRDSPEAFQFGPDAADLRADPSAQAATTGTTGTAETSVPIDPGGDTAPRSRNFPASGYAVFRSDAADAALADADERWLLLKYGPHGGGHGHPDKLAIELHAFGQRLSPDLGTPGYGVPTHRTWFRQTLSHNTVIVGEASQPATEGQLVTFSTPSDAGLGVAEAVVSWPTDTDVPSYAGVRVRRCLLWRGTYVLDVVLVGCPEPRTIDLAWHHRGTLAESGGLEPMAWEPPNETYALLTDVQRLPGSPWSAHWRLGDVGTKAMGRDPEGTDVLVATAPSNPPALRDAFLLRRAHTDRAAFVTVLEPCRGSGRIQTVDWDGNSRLAIRLREHTEVWELDLAGAVDDPAPLAWQHTIR